DPQATGDKLQTWKDNCSLFMGALYIKLQELSGPDIVQGSVRIVRGIVTGGLITRQIFKILKTLPGKVAEKAAEAVRIIQEEERIGATPEGFKFRFTNFMQRTGEISNDMISLAKRIW